MTRRDVNQQGTIIYQVLIFGAIALLYLGGLVAWSGSNVRFAHNLYYREATLDVAEAGIEYYRWHLAHAPTDFQDGTGLPGPYTHPYNDARGNTIGQFVLEIIPPQTGSSVATVRSTGSLTAAPTVKRTIEVVTGKLSLAKFAVAANADIRFGSGTEVSGPIHSNGGIRFDGLAHNIVTSAKANYDDPDHTGGNEFGVHTHVSPTDPLPPAAVPQRTDVFEVGRSFPVPAVDFAGFTADLANIKAQAQGSGVYLPNSGALGYHLVLKTDDTMDIYKVTATVSPPGGCTNILGQSGWGTWSIKSESFQQNRPLPSNGAIFVEDHVWVDGKINTARQTIASARFPEDPSTDTNITVNADLLYTNYEGSDVLSLIAQNNIHAGMVSADVMRIDAALIAKNGRVGRHYYESDCSPYHKRNTITLYGLIATNKRYGFAYTDGTGYTNRIINYDPNLLYSPPPFFPLTTDQYELLRWREAQ